MTLDMATIRASLLQPYVGELFQMVHSPDLAIPVQLKRCSEFPEGKMQGTPRTPFSLEFEAEDETVPPFQWGDFSFFHPDVPAIGPVHVSRILNPTAPTRALFQVVFG